MINLFCRTGLWILHLASAINVDVFDIITTTTSIIIISRLQPWSDRGALISRRSIFLDCDALTSFVEMEAIFTNVLCALQLPSDGFIVLEWKQRLFKWECQHKRRDTNIQVQSKGFVFGSYKAIEFGTTGDYLPSDAAVFITKIMSFHIFGYHKLKMSWLWSPAFFEMQPSGTIITIKSQSLSA